MIFVSKPLVHGMMVSSMTNKLLVSIVVPIYNVEDYLETCVESLLRQSYDNLEIILVDDGSPDRSGEMCDELAQGDRRIKVVHKHNEGLNYARKTGFEHSTGDYILFVDSDDAIREDTILRMLEMAQSKSIDLVVGGYVKFSDDLPSLSQPQDSLPEIMLDRTSAIRKLLIGGGQENILMMTAWCKLFARSVLDGVDWDASNYRSNEDEFMALQYYSSITTDIALLPEGFYMYRESPGSITRAAYRNSFNGDTLSRFDTIERIYQEATHRLGDEFSSYILAKFIYEFIIVSYKEACSDSSIGGAIKAYDKYFRPKKTLLNDGVVEHLDTLTKIQFEGLVDAGVVGCFRAKINYLEETGVEYRSYLQNLEKSIVEKDRTIGEQTELLSKRGRIRDRFVNAFRKGDG